MVQENRFEDSELGSWTHLDFRPTTHRATVESVWLFKGKLTRPERHYPTGTFDVLLHLGPSETFNVVHRRSTQALPAACLTGMTVSPFEIHPTTFTSMMLGVTLRPTGAATLFDPPLHEVTDTALSLDQLIGTEAQRLIDQLHEAASASDRVHLLTRWIVTRLAQRPKANNIVELAVSEIERSRGTLRIASLLKTLGVSAKRLTHLFQHHVGVSPKTFCRIVRFRSAIEHLYSTDITLAQLATTYGYYDQAHMNADFRQYAGISPGQFFATKRFPGSHTLAV